MADEEEKSPLLGGEAREAELYRYSLTDSAVSAPPYQDEAPPPPPYYEVPAVGASSRCCGVCGARLEEEAKSKYTLKCGVCQEYTPVRAPPVGKRFVRCPCHCLLMCKSSAQIIGCPRPECKRVIQLSSPGPVNTVVQDHEGRASCGHCSQTFLIPQSAEKKCVRCPHCRKVSFVGQRYPMKRCVYFSLMAIFFAIVAGGLI
ncbi:type I phosphatidylinositol 4,5-bisphosphate 4-phosphatase-A, partial [Clarias magur]